MNVCKKMDTMKVINYYWAVFLSVLLASLAVYFLILTDITHIAI